MLPISFGSSGVFLHVLSTVPVNAKVGLYTIPILFLSFPRPVSISDGDVLLMNGVIFSGLGLDFCAALNILISRARRGVNFVVLVGWL